jgi:DNA-binding transcriptional regulator YiaG
MKTRTGREIKEARQALRLKSTELAAICSIRPETLSRIENGKDCVPGYVDLIVAFMERNEEAVRFAMGRRGL